MNRHLYVKLVRKGFIKTVKELEARERIRDGGGIVYSTEEAAACVIAADKNKGTIPASSEIRGKNVFDPSRLTSGRKTFITVADEVVPTSKFHMRVMRP